MYDEAIGTIQLNLLVSKRGISQLVGQSYIDQREMIKRNVLNSWGVIRWLNPSVLLLSVESALIDCAVDVGEGRM